MSEILNRIEKIAKGEGITIGALERTIGASKGVLSRAISNNTDIQSKWIQLIVENYPHYSCEWLMTGREPMIRKENKELNIAKISYDPTIGVPYYDVDFAAGFNLLYNDQTIVPTYNIIFQPFEDAQFWCNVTGRSMEPKLNPGDIIALKEIPSIDDILYGEIYAVVLKNMRTIKIIRKADDPDMLRFIPININNFDEQVFPKNNIEKVFVVMGCISKFS